VNSGEVVVRSIETSGHYEYTPIDLTANLAARLQTSAPAGSIAASEHTRKLVEGYFELRALGPIAEAGPGKSRLFHEFKATQPAGCKVLEAHSVSHGKAAAYLPLLELLHTYFGIAGVDDPSTRRRKVSSKLAAIDPALSDTLPYLSGLFGIQEDSDPLAQMDAQVRKRRMLEAVKQILRRESLIQPLIVIFEDLHWIDAETQELLDLLVDSLPSAHILMLVNYRPEYHHGWGNRACYSQLRVAPLDRESADQMLHALLGSDASLQSLKRLIVDKSGGNPFFVEEIVRALVEQRVLLRNGTTRLIKPLTEIHVPSSIQGILASRIDGLSASEKDLLQTMAVVGEDFPLNLIKHIVESPEDRVAPLLKSLQSGEFIYEQPGLGEAEYTFKHVLTREVAYNAMLMERRRVLHERTGQVIEALFKNRIDDHLAELAHHNGRSANTRKAVEYLFRAGRQAAARSAYSEAVTRLSSALAFLERLPDNAERARQELSLRSVLAGTLALAKGYAATELEAVYARTRELCARIRDPALAFHSLYGQWLMRWWKLEVRRALEIADELVAAAEETKDPAMLLIGNQARGIILY
jgi:predicted ATPase